MKLNRHIVDVFIWQKVVPTTILPHCINFSVLESRTQRSLLSLVIHGYLTTNLTRESFIICRNVTAIVFSHFFYYFAVCELVESF